MKKRGRSILFALLISMIVLGVKIQNQGNNEITSRPLPGCHGKTGI